MNLEQTKHSYQVSKNGKYEFLYISYLRPRKSMEESVFLREVLLPYQINIAEKKEIYAVFIINNKKYIFNIDYIPNSKPLVKISIIKQENNILSKEVVGVINDFNSSYVLKF